MKKQIRLLILISAAVAVMLPLRFLITHAFVVLEDNTLVIADEAWLVGDKLFYRNKARIDFAARNAVQDFRAAGGWHPVDIVFKVKQSAGAASGMLRDQLAVLSLRRLNSRSWAALGGLAAGLAAASGLCLVIVRRRGDGRRNRKEDAGAAGKPPPEPAECSEQDSVVDCFLKIFKLQKGCREAPAGYKMLDAHTAHGSCVYELRVKTGDEWTTRRMSIAPIGEDSGSRSRCYFVIYDDHLVVKIPPLPLKSFQAYVDSLKRDADIAAKLAPRECLVPRVSVVMRKIHPLDDSGDMTADRLEADYINWLKTNEEFRQYLTIGESYAFFMDLSRYFFLGHILSMIHDPAAKIAREILEHHNLIWRPVDFEARYGSNCGHIPDLMQPVYREFERGVQSLQWPKKTNQAPHDFQMKEWFATLLAEKTAATAPSGNRPDIPAKVHVTANALFARHKDPVRTYHLMVESYVLQRNLNQYKAEIGSLITNLLDLLAWLGEKKVAMRDLKPDNLLIAGDPNRYPQFLESAGRYSIGLIDLETAVAYDSAPSKPLPQPQIGGTPSFATPSHFVPNALLAGVYNRPADILHLQDWYATVGMIFKVITGERLFHHTARKLVEVKKDIHRRLRDRLQPSAVLMDASSVFWWTALREFEKKLYAKEKKLKFIHLVPTPGSAAMLTAVLTETHKRLTAVVHKKIEAQTVFKDPKLKKRLLAAHHSNIRQFRRKFESDAGQTAGSAGKHQQACLLLEELERWKKQSGDIHFVLNALKKSTPLLNAYDLMEAMFTVVLLNMHQFPRGLPRSVRAG